MLLMSENFKTSLLPLTTIRIVEMKLVDNSTNLTMVPVGKIMSSWAGHILDKDDREYVDWGNWNSLWSSFGIMGLTCSLIPTKYINHMHVVCGP